MGGLQVLGGRRVSVEAIKELQVISAPFDVRFGNFAASLVNAVTKSGANRFEGSVSSFYADCGLVGKDPGGGRGDDFENKEISATLGGPIVRDRAVFFIDAGLQRMVIPETAALLGNDPTAPIDTAVKVGYASAVRFQSILRTTSPRIEASWMTTPRDGASSSGRDTTFGSALLAALVHCDRSILVVVKNDLRDEVWGATQAVHHRADDYAWGETEQPEGDDNRQRSRRGQQGVNRIPL